MRTDVTLLTLEIAAAALALEGEDGVTELLSLGTHAEFETRSNVAVSLSLLGRSARWPVPTLIRFLDREPVEWIGRQIIWTLGQIGGREAIAKLQDLALVGVVRHCLRTRVRGVARCARSAPLGDVMGLMAKGRL